LNYLKTHFDQEGGEVLILQGRDASKTRLKSHSPPPRILHLATHGCFIAPAHPAERPMTLSLLALAGANLAATATAAAAGSDDGILHALEVLDLNLTGTELVTLSACDTGKGKVDRSEGVYGMVRAFQIAGAANVLMTLRPLNDDLADEFVSDFYRNWLDRAPDLPADPASALRRTQLDWIASGRPEKRDPRHWAPYVLVERK
jgi:CHAT domain-containing protein